MIQIECTYYQVAVEKLNVRSTEEPSTRNHHEQSQDQKRLSTSSVSFNSKNLGSPDQRRQAALNQLNGQQQQFQYDKTNENSNFTTNQRQSAQPMQLNYDGGQFVHGQIVQRNNGQDEQFQNPSANSSVTQEEFEGGMTDEDNQMIQTVQGLDSGHQTPQAPISSENRCDTKRNHIIEGLKLEKKVVRFRVKQKYFLGISNLYSLMQPVEGQDSEPCLPRNAARFKDSDGPSALQGKLVLPEGISKETFRRFLEFTLNSGNEDQQIDLMDSIMSSLEEHAIAELIPDHMKKLVNVYPNLALHCYNSAQERVSGRNIEVNVYESEQFMQVAGINRVLEFVKLANMFKLVDESTVKLLIQNYVNTYIIKPLEQSSISSIQDEYLYHEMQLKLIDALAIIKSISWGQKVNRPWSASEDVPTQPSHEAPAIDHWIDLEHTLSKMLVMQLARYFQIKELKLQEALLSAFMNLKRTISTHFVEKLIQNYCFIHRMLLPRKNGSEGLAVLKIIDLLMKLRGIDNVFELLDNEQKHIEQNSEDPNNQMINVLNSTRIQIKKLQKTFYKELEPFSQEGLNWNMFVWRVNADLDGDKYLDHKRDEDEEQQICRLYRKQMNQLARQSNDFKDLPEDPEAVQDLFDASNGLDEAVNYNLENDAHAIIDQMVNHDNANVAEVSVRLRPYIRPAQSNEYFGKEKIIGSKSAQNSFMREFDVHGNNDSQGIDQPTKHLIISYQSQVKLTFLDSEQALFLAQENQQLHGQVLGPNGEELVSHNSLTASDFVHSEMQNLIGDMSTRRTFTLKPQLFCSIFGGKQHNQVADMIFPSTFCFDRMIIDVSVSMACVHQMILRYIAEYFDRLTLDDPRIGLIRYDQFVILLKNKYLNACNEDVIVSSVEAWISGNPEFMENALEHDNTHVSNDQGTCFAQMEELINNINWPIVSLACLMRTVCKPRGTLKQFTLIRKRVFEELQRRQSGLMMPKSKEMPLRHCQLNQKQAYFSESGIHRKGNGSQGNDCDSSQTGVEDRCPSRTFTGPVGPCLHTECDAASDQICSHQREREMMCQSIANKLEHQRDTTRPLPFMQQLLMALIEQSEHTDQDKEDHSSRTTNQQQAIHHQFCPNCKSILKIDKHGVTQVGANARGRRKPNILSMISLHTDKSRELAVETAIKACQTDEPERPPSLRTTCVQTDEKRFRNCVIQTDEVVNEVNSRKSERSKPRPQADLLVATHQIIPNNITAKDKHPVKRKSSQTEKKIVVEANEVDAAIELPDGQRQTSGEITSHSGHKIDAKEYAEFLEFKEFKKQQMKLFMESKYQRESETNQNNSKYEQSVHARGNSLTINNNMMQREMSFGLSSQQQTQKSQGRQESGLIPVGSNVMEERQLVTDHDLQQDRQISAQLANKHQANMDQPAAYQRQDTLKKQNLSKSQGLNKERGSVSSNQKTKPSKYDWLAMECLQSRRDGEERTQRSQHSWNMSHFLNGTEDNNQIQSNKPPIVQEIQGQVECREPTTFKVIQDSNAPYIQIEAPPYGNYQYDYKNAANRSQIERRMTPLVEEAQKIKKNDSVPNKKEREQHLSTGSIMPSIDSNESQVEDPQLDVCDILITGPEYPPINGRQDMRIPVTIEPRGFKTLKCAKTETSHQRCNSSLVQQFAGIRQGDGLISHGQSPQYDSSGQHKNFQKQTKHFQELFPVNAHGSHGSSVLRFVRGHTEEFNKDKIIEACLRTTERQMYTEDGTDVMPDKINFDQTDRTLREGYNDKDSDGVITQEDIGGNNTGQKYELLQKALGRQIHLQQEDLAMMEYRQSLLTNHLKIQESRHNQQMSRNKHGRLTMDQLLNANASYSAYDNQGKQQQFNSMNANMQGQDKYRQGNNYTADLNSTQKFDELPLSPIKRPQTRTTAHRILCQNEI